MTILFRPIAAAAVLLAAAFGLAGCYVTPIDGGGPTYYASPVYAAPVYVAPAPVYIGRPYYGRPWGGYYHGQGHGQGHGHRWH